MATAAPPEVLEERKVVTALFADIVGSTHLAERLDPEDVKLVVGDAVARMVMEVERLGGHVKDLAGDGVLAFFGAPVSYEDDAERAVRAGLRIVDELARYGEDVARGWGVSGFSVRVGISTGPVVVGLVGAGQRVEYGAFGDTVNTAARIQGAAPPGGVLVDETTRRLVAELFEWGAEVRLELKGKERPVSAHTVGGAVAGARRTRGFGGVRADLVGRDREVGRGYEALDALHAGTGCVLFVTGEAGIGKSRLLYELRDHFESAVCPRGRAVWLEGRCLSYGEALPYWPYRDLLRAEWLEVGHDEPELRVRVALRRRLEALFGDRADELYPYLGALIGLPLEPEATARVDELAPEALRYRTFEVVETLLARLAEDGPVVLAVEDMHWADATSVELTERLLRTAERAAVGIVAAQRDERDHSSWQLREAAAREFPHLLHELALEPLPDDDQRRLLAALVAGAELPPEVESRLLATAEGNPFYLEELVSSLADVGALVRENGGWRFESDVPVEVPQTVEKVIVARIDRLPPQCRRILTAASALGRRFGLPLLSGVLAGEDAASVQDALHELQRLDFVQPARRWPEPEFRFKHALIQETAYRTMLSGPRAELHRRAAEWLEKRYEEHEEDVLGVLAHHWRAAAQEDKAIDCHMRAGDRAREKYALDEAIEHYRALLELLERRGEEQVMAIVLFKLALALHTSLRFAEANAAYQQAFEHWQPDTAAVPAEATLRVATGFLPRDADPASAIAWPNIQLGMQLFDRLVEAWPEQTIVPSLAEWWEISEDGLRYVFRLREGLRWSDGEPLTAHDLVYGVKRVLDPERPGASAAIYFVVEGGQDYCLGRGSDADAVGVRALDDRTIEFALAAPAPYFMSVVNRPDAAPMPRHAIERDGDAWTEPGRQVVSGAFRQEERGESHLVLVRRDDYDGKRMGNVRRVELYRIPVEAALEPFERGEFDVVLVRYTPLSAEFVSTAAVAGAAAWSCYLAFDHRNGPTAQLEVRRALAHAVDREGLEPVAGFNLSVARGGVIPPALQGHTPDIALRFDPALAREYLAQAGRVEGLGISAPAEWKPAVDMLVAGWEEVLGLELEVDYWTGSRPKSSPQPIVLAGWLPGYPDPEYYLRLLLHSESKTNEGGFSYPPFDELIERAQQERRGRERLELFHEADRLAVADRVAMTPIAYGRSLALVNPRIAGWWEFGKSSASFADLVVDQR